MIDHVIARVRGIRLAVLAVCTGIALTVGGCANFGESSGPSPQGSAPGAQMQRAITTVANLKDSKATRKRCKARGPHVDLHGCNLTGANLKGIDLRGAQLYGTKLSRANLRGARLDHSNLKGAILQKTNLVSASLNGANLKDARLKGANFKGADLDNAIFAGAKGCNGVSPKGALARKC